MLSSFRLSRKTLLPMLCTFLLAGFSAQAAQADIVGTQALITEMSASDVRAHLSNSLSRQDVQDQLQSYGINPEDAAARVAALTEHEAQQLAAHFDDMPAGGDVVILLVVILLVLLLR